MVGQAIGGSEGQGFFPEQGHNLGRLPDIRGPFLVVGVRVERAGEEAVGQAHLALQPANSFLADPRIQRVAVAGPGFGVGAE